MIHELKIRFADICIIPDWVLTLFNSKLDENHIESIKTLAERADMTVDPGAKVLSRNIQQQKSILNHIG